MIKTSKPAEIDPIKAAVARGRLTAIQADAIRRILNSDLDGAKGDQELGCSVWAWNVADESLTTLFELS